MASLIKKNQGFSLLEILVAIGVLVLVMVGSLSANNIAANSVSINKVRDRANLLAKEGVEALYSVRAANFTSLMAGDFHPVLVSEMWTLSPGSEAINGFTRTISLSPVQRMLVCADPVCPIVTSGGLTDNLTYKATVEVTWKEGDTDKIYQINTLVTYWR